MTELLVMGGHGVYVWSAYGLGLLALAGIGAWPLMRLRAVARRLRARNE